MKKMTSRFSIPQPGRKQWNHLHPVGPRRFFSLKMGVFLGSLLSAFSLAGQRPVTPVYPAVIVSPATVEELFVNTISIPGPLREKMIDLGPGEWSLEIVSRENYRSSPVTAGTVAVVTINQEQHLLGVLQHWIRNIRRRKEHATLPRATAVVTAPPEKPQSAARSAPLTPAIRAFPNPFNDRLQVQYFAGEPAQAELRLLDAAGKLHWKRSENISAGVNHFELDLFGQFLPAGTYFLQLSDGRRVRETLPLIRQ